ncbi:MAG: hypothetical protein N3B01_12025, partial [Verrucomicrobiae bacterium]|nr:hypothetical protein [Verrucomicrobiae bacterium]
DETRRGAVFAARGTLVSLATVVAFWLQFATEVLKETPASVALRWLGTATLTAGALALLTMLSVLRQTRR